MPSQTDIEPQPTTASTQQPDTRVVDNKSIVTPYAFGVADELLNHPLASPTRRLCAMLIDLLCIAIMSTLNAFFLAGFAALTLLRTNIRLARQKQMPRTRILLSVFIVLLVLFVLFGIVDSITGEEEQTSDPEVSGAQVIATGALYLAWYNCGDINCKTDLLDGFIEVYGESDIDEEQLVDAFSEFLGNDPQLSEQQRTDLLSAAQTKFSAYQAERLKTETADSTELTNETEQPESIEPEAPSTDDTMTYSVVKWSQGIIEDLGLGFGWAALYFSAFTTIWHGATPGKRIMGIYVVRLDGRIPTLWESFGRYGGYGAGLATGLSGFLQIYWDPNRQAIQDKISETLVLRRVNSWRRA